MRDIRDAFDRMAEWTARNLGSPVAFGLAFLAVLLWALSGPVFAFSQTWQLIINTGTTIATFLMVFLLQNSSNRSQEELRQLVADMAEADRKVLERLDTIEDIVEEDENE